MWKYTAPTKHSLACCNMGSSRAGSLLSLRAREFIQYGKHLPCWRYVERESHHAKAGYESWFITASIQVRSIHKPSRRSTACHRQTRGLRVSPLHAPARAELAKLLHTVVSVLQSAQPQAGSASSKARYNNNLRGKDWRCHKRNAHNRAISPNELARGGARPLSVHTHCASTSATPKHSSDHASKWHTMLPTEALAAAASAFADTTSARASARNSCK